MGQDWNKTNKDTNKTKQKERAQGPTSDTNGPEA